MNALVTAIFAVVYLGMVLGRLPGWRLDRTGIALLGAIALLGIGAIDLGAAVRAVDWPTMALLFAFMLISAQLRLAGFYDGATRRLAGLPLAPPMLLGVLVFGSGGLSALFSNDIVCLAAAPLLVDACRARRLDPKPFLLALACAANIGSAATLIGNPQNMLIGETLHLSFGAYLRAATLPVLLSLAATWALVFGLTRGRLEEKAAGQPCPDTPPGTRPQIGPQIEPDLRQGAKGLCVALAVVACFLWTSLPRAEVALAGAGVLLCSRRVASQDLLRRVDWELLMLFIGLFVVNAALLKTGLPARAVAALAAAGVPLQRPAPLFAAAFALSNLVSNVPATMLLLPGIAASGNTAVPGLLLALVSTLAGNLIVVGSIANIIVVDAAARKGIAIDWREHARVGMPVTIATLSIVACMLAW